MVNELSPFESRMSCTNSAGCGRSSASRGTPSSRSSCSPASSAPAASARRTRTSSSSASTSSPYRTGASTYKNTSKYKNKSFSFPPSSAVYSSPKQAKKEIRLLFPPPSELKLLSFPPPEPQVLWLVNLNPCKELDLDGEELNFVVLEYVGKLNPRNRWD
jgi:hypothetical protein